MRGFDIVVNLPEIMDARRRSPVAVAAHVAATSRYEQRRTHCNSVTLPSSWLSLAGERSARACGQEFHAGRAFRPAARVSHWIDSYQRRQDTN